MRTPILLILRYNFLFPPLGVEDKLAGSSIVSGSATRYGGMRILSFAAAGSGGGRFFFSDVKRGRGLLTSVPLGSTGKRKRETKRHSMDLPFSRSFSS